MGPLNPSAFPKGSTLAVDTVTLIYFLEHHPVHHPTARKLLERIEAGEVRGVLSTLAFAELLVPAYRAGDPRRAASVRRLLSGFPNLDLFDVTAEISVEAARLRARYGLRTPDAIHAATALAAGADGIVTNDRDLVKVSPEITVWRFEDG